MKITELTTWVVANPPPRHGGPYWVFLKLTTDNGIAGYEEAYGVPFNPRRVTGLIEDVFERLRNHGVTVPTHCSLMRT